MDFIGCVWKEGSLSKQSYSGDNLHIPSSGSTPCCTALIFLACWGHEVFFAVPLLPREDDLSVDLGEVDTINIVGLTKLLGNHIHRSREFGE